MSDENSYPLPDPETALHRVQAVEELLYILAAHRDLEHFPEVFELLHHDLHAARLALKARVLPPFKRVRAVP